MRSPHMRSPHMRRPNVPRARQGNTDLMPGLSPLPPRPYAEQFRVTRPRSDREEVHQSVMQPKKSRVAQP